MLHYISPSLAISTCISNSIHPVWCIDIIFFFLSFTYLSSLSCEFRCVNTNRVATTRTISSQILSSIVQRKKKKKEEKKRNIGASFSAWLVGNFIVTHSNWSVRRFFSCFSTTTDDDFLFSTQFFLSIAYTSDFFSVLSSAPAHFSHSTAKMTTT
jgi:hypothetical protein